MCTPASRLGPQGGSGRGEQAKVTFGPVFAPPPSHLSAGGACKYLSMPASSAGVERVFSAAGRMHDDLRKSAKDNTLEHSLFAAFNTD